MATRQTQTLARVMIAPSVVVLLIWMIVPLALTLWFSLQNYNILRPERQSFAGFDNFYYVYTDPAFWQSIQNTLIIVLGVLAITVVIGTLLALLLDQPIWGQGIVRILVISPFFVMPPVAAVIWKHEIMNPSWGVFAELSRALGQQPIDWFANYPLFSFILIVT